MKSALIFIVAFIVATAGAAGVKVMLTKPLPPVAGAADSTATKKDSTQTDTAIVASHTAVPATADSTHPDAAHPDSAHPVAGRPDSTKPVAISAPTAPVIQPMKSLVPPPGNKAPDNSAAKAANDTAVVSSERRVAKVFTSMDAKQAAKVLERMADDDVHIILGYVGPRQAASIMAALPPERVATLSKLAMRGTKK